MSIAIILYEQINKKVTKSHNNLWVTRTGSEENHPQSTRTYLQVAVTGLSETVHIQK